MRREGPIALCLIVGLLVIGANFFGGEAITTFRGEIDQWYLVVTSMAVFLGIINLTVVHGHKITQKREGWIYSAICLGAAWGMTFFGLARGNFADEKFNWLYNTTVSPMTTAMFGVLMFYIGSSAYRSFRIRTKEAAVLLISAVIVMLGRVPIGAVMFEQLPSIQQWIMNWPNTAGMRAIQLGATFGGLAAAFRMLIGLERSYLGDGK